MTDSRSLADLAVRGGADFLNPQEAAALYSLMAAGGPAVYEGKGYRAEVRADGHIEVTRDEAYQARGLVVRADLRGQRRRDLTGHDMAGRLMALRMAALGL